MKRLAMLFGLFASTVLAQTTPGPATYVQIRTAPTIGAACTSNTTVWVPSTRRSYCCVGSVWTACDAPADCAANPPVGACNSGQMCSRTDSGALYNCVSSAWVAVGVLPAGAAGTIQATDGSSSLQASNITLSSDFDQNGTASSADLDGNGTVDDSGYVSTSDLRATRLWSRAVTGPYDPDGSGAVDSWMPTSAKISSIMSATLHASLYGDPSFYLRPAVYDSYGEVFQGRPLYADCDSDGTAGGASGAECGVNAAVRPAIAQCASNNCAVDGGYICVTSSDVTANGAADTNADGTVDFAVGDLVTFSTAVNKSTGGRTYWIRTIGNGTGVGTDCAIATDNRILVSPDVDQNGIDGVDQDASGAVDSNMTLARVWANNTHPSREGAHLIGYRLGYASRTLHGSHGPNLLRNGAADAQTSTTAQNWSVVGTGALARNSFTATPCTSPPCYGCLEGGSNACLWYNGSTNGSALESVDAINVTPGEVLSVSGMVMMLGGPDTVGFSDERDGDGTWSASSDLYASIVATQRAANFAGQHSWLWETFEIPEGVHQVKVRWTRGSTTASTPSLDGFSVRRVSTWQYDSWTENPNGGSSFLINHPGERCIVMFGDSWTDASTAYSHVRIGLADALAARYTDKSSAQWQTQIVLSGVGGYTAENVLDNWYALVGKYDCLYAVVIESTNEIASGTALATWLPRIRQIAARLKQEGMIPIFVSPAPLGPAADAKMTTSRQFRDAQRRALLYESP